MPVIVMRVKVGDGIDPTLADPHEVADLLIDDSLIEQSEILSAEWEN